MRGVLECISPLGRSIRDNSKGTAAGSLRPDYAFLLNKLCLFWGVEEGPENNANPKK